MVACCHYRICAFYFWSSHSCRFCDGIFDQCQPTYGTVSLNRYLVDKPTPDDRSKFIEQLVEAVFSFQLEESASRSKETRPLPELPKVPKEVSGPKASELKAKAEAEQHALRRLRMCLRDVCNRYASFSIFKC